MTVYEETCKHLAVDLKKVASIARRLDKIGLDMKALGIFHFGGSGGGQLRFDSGEGYPHILAEMLHGNWDGGDGATHQDADGHWRGE